MRKCTDFAHWCRVSVLKYLRETTHDNAVNMARYNSQPNAIGLFSLKTRDRIIE